MPLTSRVVSCKSKREGTETSSKRRGTPLQPKEFAGDPVKASKVELPPLSAVSNDSSPRTSHASSCDCSSSSSNSSGYESLVTALGNGDLGVYLGPMVPAGQGCYTGWTYTQRMYQGRLVMHQVFLL